jgi:hypothetical protein
MTRPRTATVAALAAAAALAGCGSQTKTVTVASAPADTGVQTTTSTATGTTSAPVTTTSATTPTQTEASSTRTAPEPSFAEGQSHSSSEGASAAAALVGAHGFTARDTAEYHPGQTLRVLVGTRTAAGTQQQQAFFFLEGRYLGTDAKSPSGRISVVSQSDTEVAIAYGIYRQGDSACCPSGGSQVVHFALDDGRLTALDPIPPLSSRT